MRVRADRFQIVLVRQIRIRRARKASAPARRVIAFTTYSCHKKLCRRRVPKSLTLSPGTPRSRSIFSHSRVFARAYRMSSSNSLSRFRLARVFSSLDRRQRINLPHRRLRPQPVETSARPARRATTVRNPRAGNPSPATPETPAQRSRAAHKTCCPPARSAPTCEIAASASAPAARATRLSINQSPSRTVGRPVGAAKTSPASSGNASR